MKTIERVLRVIAAVPRTRSPSFAGPMKSQLSEIVSAICTFERVAHACGP